MSQEIITAVRELEREKGIEGGTLVKALEDGLLAAYKKTPGSSRHASAHTRSSPTTISTSTGRTSPRSRSSAPT